jgi:hypothetical protein
MRVDHMWIIGTFETNRGHGTIIKFHPMYYISKLIKLSKANKSNHCEEISWDNNLGRV